MPRNFIFVQPSNLFMHAWIPDWHMKKITKISLGIDEIIATGLYWRVFSFLDPTWVLIMLDSLNRCTWSTSCCRDLFMWEKFIACHLCVSVEVSLLLALDSHFEILVGWASESMRFNAFLYDYKRSVVLFLIHRSSCHVFSTGSRAGGLFRSDSTVIVLWQLYWVIRKCMRW